MGKYDHLSKEELIQRIERLEADLVERICGDHGERYFQRFPVYLF